MEHEVFERYGLTALILLMVIQQLVPVVKTILIKVVPDRMKRIRTNEEKLLDLEKREMDLQERSISAQEQIAKALILLQNNQLHIEQRFVTDFNDVKITLGNIETALASALNGISILLDRNMRLRTTDLDEKEKK